MRILWLKSELLHPLDKGGKIRTYQMLKHLMRDHEVTYLSFAEADCSPESFRDSEQYCHRLITIPWREVQKFSGRFYRDLTRNLFSPIPYAIQKYRANSMRRAIEREVSRLNYDVVVCDFLATSVNLPPTPGCAAVLFQHNVESTIWRRHFETQNNALKRAFLKTQWCKMFAYEHEACGRFDAVIAVSKIDRDQLRDQFGLHSVYDVPTGVDTQYFQPISGQANPFELVFTGSMDWIPNEDAILFFAEEILPIVANSIPNLRLRVVGRNPGPALLRLDRANPRVEVTGRVDDIRSHVGRAAAYVVPIRIGGGTRLKIFEAMAMGKPVISTTVGAEGLPVSDGREILIADDPEEFARATVRVLTDPPLAASLGRQARAVVCEKFGWDRAADLFAEVCERVATKRTKRSAPETPTLSLRFSEVENPVRES